MDFITSLFTGNSKLTQKVIPIKQEIKLLDDYVYDRKENNNDKNQRALMKKIENKKGMTLNDAILISYYNQSKQ